MRAVADPGGPRNQPLTAAAFDAMTLPSGEAGEIVVRGEHVLTGYLATPHQGYDHGGHHPDGSTTTP